MAEQLLEHFVADSLDVCLAYARRDPVWVADLIAQRAIRLRVRLAGTRTFLVAATVLAKPRILTLQEFLSLSRRGVL